MGRSEDNTTIGQEIAARRSAHACGDQFVVGQLAYSGGSRVHHVNLVASLIVDLAPVALEDDIGIVKAPVGLGVIASESELFHVSKMGFVFES